jgi:(1->4)-alpha-D-glucan 1-alpha-D-glucosylmutase
MTDELGGQFDPEAAREAAMRVQQYTGPVMAKGLEDTALYRQSRLIALNDVGSHPDRYARTISSFHDVNRGNLARSPDMLLTTSSHDTKRGEDVRARVAALSGLPLEWAELMTVWGRLLVAAGIPPIHPDDLWYLCQLMLGAWPVALPAAGPPSADGLAAFRARLEAAMLKSIREARLRTDWDNPDVAYEDAVKRTIRALLSPGRSLQALLAFDRRIGWHGAANGLVLVALKLTSPGVPDVYRGAEGWEQSLVDPDNRRPLDFAALQQHLAAAEGEAWPALVAGWRDGRVKQRLVAALLDCRREYPELFSRGSYEPVGVEDAPVCAFLRRHGDAALLVAVRLWPWRALAARALRPGLPDGLAVRRWRPFVAVGNADPSDLRTSREAMPVAVMIAT